MILIRSAFVGAMIAALALPLAGQQRDTTRRAAAIAAPGAPAPDPFQPPITPRRAFFYSFLAPGYSQSILGRHKAGAAFLLVEAISLAMIRESAADVHEARRTANDSLVVRYVDDVGNPSVQKVAPRFEDKDVHTRSAHVEDWIALMVANHLFAGADAFVAAHLWDVRTRLAVRMLPSGGTVLTAAIQW